MDVFFNEGPTRVIGDGDAKVEIAVRSTFSAKPSTAMINQFMGFIYTRRDSHLNLASLYF